MRWIDDEKHEIKRRRFGVREDLRQTCGGRRVRWACIPCARRWWNPETEPARPSLPYSAKVCRSKSLLSVGVGIHLEVAGVNDDAERRVDRECNAIHQAMRDLDGMNREGSDLEALVGAHFAEVGIVQQAVLVEFVFHVGERELRAPDWDVEVRRAPRAARRCGLRGRE